MKERPSIHVAWQRLVDRYNDRIQQLKVETRLNAEQRLQAELALERAIISGLETIEAHLGLAGAFEENEEEAS